MNQSFWLGGLLTVNGSFSWEDGIVEDPGCSAEVTILFFYLIWSSNIWVRTGWLRTPQIWPVTWDWSEMLTELSAPGSFMLLTKFQMGSFARKVWLMSVKFYVQNDLDLFHLYYQALPKISAQWTLSILKVKSLVKTALQLDLIKKSSTRTCQW